MKFICNVDFSFDSIFQDSLSNIGFLTFLAKNLKCIFNIKHNTLIFKKIDKKNIKKINNENILDYSIKIFNNSLKNIKINFFDEKNKKWTYVKNMSDEQIFQNFYFENIGKENASFLLNNFSEQEKNKIYSGFLEIQNSIIFAGDYVDFDEKIILVKRSIFYFNNNSFTNTIYF